MAGSESTEFVFYEVVESREKYKNQGKIFYPEHRGDIFILKN